MSGRLRILACVAGVGALVAGGWWLQYRADDEAARTTPASDAGVAAPDAPALAWTWPDERARVYAVDWRHVGDAESQALDSVDSGERVAGAITLIGELSIAPLGDDDAGASVFALSFPAVTQLAWRVMGIDVPQDEAVARYFDGHQAFLTVSARGEIRGLRFPPGTPRPFAQTLEPLVRHAWPRLAPGAEPRWTTAAETGLGLAETRWSEVDAAGAGQRVIEAARQSNDYREQRLVSVTEPGDALVGQARGRYVFVEQRLDAVETTEHLEVVRDGRTVARADVSLKLRHLRVDAPAGATDLAAAVARDDLPDTARENALKQRLRGMTLAEIRKDLRAFGDGGLMPRHNTWLWRATGWLKLNPEGAWDLAELFREPTMGRPGQTLILDLLAAVGHAPAQAVMRELLGDDALAQRHDYPALIQRLSLLSRPEAATVELAKRRYTDAPNADVGRAAAVAMGAIAARGGDGADALVSTLTRDLSSATTVDDQRALLRALGNSRAPAAESAITARLTDAQPLVRAEAARALSRWKRPSATSKLAQMAATERDVVSQKWVLTALSQHDPAPESLRALQTLIATGGLDNGNIYEALRLLEQAEPALGADAVWPVANALRQARVGDQAARSRVNSWVEALRAKL